ncbi:hypothetical protein MA16_Dca023623 [Dendrobium catenatum]|uniref:Uncharacterized protein n=1 Tax=Dendrobium catenatum TaxID=906689 RepID=A0A2I0W2B2_9ASPA|nr:hypothetical protein MA16_Dca023623 [Dendrobium catenatum]
MEVARSRENEARELLMQKKKLLQALEKTKRRLEVLDDLSMKINEVRIFLLLIFKKSTYLHKQAMMESALRLYLRSVNHV